MIAVPLSLMPMMIWMMSHRLGHYLHWTFVVPICVSHHSAMMTTIAFDPRWTMPGPLVAAHVKREMENKRKTEKSRKTERNLTKLRLNVNPNRQKKGHICKFNGYIQVVLVMLVLNLFQVTKMDRSTQRNGWLACMVE